LTKAGKKKRIFLENNANPVFLGFFVGHFFFETELSAFKIEIESIKIGKVKK